MRIGIDATALPPSPVGAGNYMIQLIRELSALESEHEFIIFAQQHGRDMIAVADRPGFKWVCLPDRSPVRRLLWEQIEFPRLVRQNGIDLLHSLHYTRPAWLPCRSVVTIHDMTFFLFPHLHTRNKRLFFPLAIRYSSRTADALIAVSESTRQDTIRVLGVAPQKVTTVRLGVSPAFRPIADEKLKAAVRERYRLPEQFLLYVGLVEPRKNLPLLLKAYQQVLERGYRIPLVIAGRKGWGYEQVLKLLEHPALNENVLLTGYVAAEDLPIVYNLAKIFIYPSLYEGFGLPPLEAMACGTPVITSNVSSMAEHIGQAGLLIPPGNETALLEAIITLLENQELHNQLANLGPKQAAQYTWTQTAYETLQIYEKVLKRL